MLNMARGAAMIINGGMVVPLIPRLIKDPGLETYIFLGRGKLFDIIPTMTIGLLIVLVAGFIIFQKNIIGYRMRAVGGNAEAARVSGINVRIVKIIAFAILGFLAAFGGAINSAFLGNVQSTAGTGLELDVIAATILGGASLSGGEGTIVGTLIGVLLLGVLRNGLVLLGVSPSCRWSSSARSSSAPWPWTCGPGGNSRAGYPGLPGHLQELPRGSGPGRRELLRGAGGDPHGRRRERGRQVHPHEDPVGVVPSPTRGRCSSRAPHRAATRRPALSLGISTVYQELMLCENLSVVENIYLGRERAGAGRDRLEADARARRGRLLASFGVAYPRRGARVASLPIAQRQIVEIAKAINMKTEVLILDEPTSSLTVNETRVLFENLAVSASRGMSIIFISHRLEEVFEITDRISVLRDGKYLGTYVARETTPRRDRRPDRGPGALRRSSRAAAPQRPAKSQCERTGAREARGEEGGRPAREGRLEVQGLSRGKYFRDVSFSLRSGELLGFYGLQGAGRTELMQTIFGMYRARRGERAASTGSSMTAAQPPRAIREGFAYIPGGQAPPGPFRQHGRQGQHCRHPRQKITVVRASSRRARLIAIAREYVDKLSIKVTGLVQRMANLSGGNQQKVIIGR